MCNLTEKPLGRLRCKWGRNIDLDLRERRWEGANWIDLAQDRKNSWCLLNTVMNLCVSLNSANSVTSWGVLSVSRKAFSCGVSYQLRFLCLKSADLMMSTFWLGHSTALIITELEEKNYAVMRNIDRKQICLLSQLKNEIEIWIALGLSLQAYISLANLLHAAESFSQNELGSEFKTRSKTSLIFSVKG